METANAKHAKIYNVEAFNGNESVNLRSNSATRSRRRSSGPASRASRIHVHSMMSSEPSDGGTMPDVERISRETTETEENLVEQAEEPEQDTTVQDTAEAKKKTIKKLTEEQVTAKAEDVVPRLLCSDDYGATDSSKGLTFLRKYASFSMDNDRRVRYFDKLAELGVVALFEKVWTTNFTDSFPNDIGDELWNSMKSILLVMWNGTDRSTKLCQTVLEKKTYLYVIKWLTDPKLAPEKTKGVHRSYTIKGLFGIIHNTLANCDARPIFREAGMIEALKPFLQAPNLMIRTKTIILLAFLITEEEDHLISSDDANFMLLIKILQSCLEKKDRFSRKYGFRANEVLEVFNLLGAIDSNKEKIVNNGILPIYNKLLDQQRSSKQREEEQVLSAKGIWTLAFHDKIRKQILEMSSLMSSLSNSANGDDTPESVKQAARGALWVLEGKDEQQRTVSAKDSKTQSRTEHQEEGHIMISYNWGSKPTMLKVRDRLKAAGFNVWMDVDNMTGSTLEAMAKAVENSALVIICMTQKYKESPSCRTEAEYTYKLRKKFIPLRLENKYNPDGWLGIMIGTKLWFDFSVDTKFEPSLQGLIKEIRSRGSDQALKQTVEPINHLPPVQQTQTVSLPQSTSHSQSSSWTKDQVKEWMKENNLSDITKTFQDFTGKDLMRLKRVLQTAPEFYYSSLRDNLKLPLLHILRFTEALEDI